jgi:hypothetical protein
MQAKYHNDRIVGSKNCNAVDGKVTVSYNKLIFFGGMLLTSTIGGVLTFSLEALVVFM